MRSKWQSLAGPEYRLVDLGRPAVFLLPTKKLTKAIEKDLHRFILAHFGAYTTSTIPSFGFWKDADRATISDECRIYEVSFLGKDRIPVLLRKLAEIAAQIHEECIYLKAGQYTALVYPKRTKQRKPPQQL
jgi:hypothetical protein